LFFSFENSSAGVTPANRVIYGLICNGNLPIEGSASVTLTFTRKWNPGETLYIEIIRVTNILVQFNLYSDPDFTFLIEQKTGTIPSGVDGLRYVSFNGRVLNRAGVITHSIDDIKIWDGVDVADPITTNTHLEIFSHYQPSGSGVIRGLLDFNLDQASNYAQRLNTNGTIPDPATTVNQPALFGQNYFEVFFQRYSVFNSITEEKFVNWLECSSPLGNTAPQRAEIVGKWANKITPISRLLIRNDQVGDLAVDSEVEVFGDT